ncbi:hypothetical protein CAEBREN_31110 [Caenorhabditis brenneri]|uniref:Uncharacterized protein n=1 Tax=Caenorhabditis brenneri TaxID=135651 RepID=G0MQT8_CAEBE|nr:hypothetical protein CAEBREN_31110 [Caenorhabditis brenneri]
MKEESDEIRSLTGSSLASPRTVVDRRLSNISLLSPTPDEDFEQLDQQQQQGGNEEVRGSDSRNSLLEEEEEEERIVEQRTTRQIEITQSASEDDRLDLLKELAKIGKSNSSVGQKSREPRQRLRTTQSIGLLVAELVDQVDLEKPLIATIIQMSTTAPEKPEEIIDATGTSDVEVEKKEVVIVKATEVEEEKKKDDDEEPDYAQVPAESEDEGVPEIVKELQEEISEAIQQIEQPQKAELGSFTILKKGHEFEKSID